MLEKIAHIMKTKGGVDDWNSEYQNNKQVFIIITNFQAILIQIDL